MDWLLYTGRISELKIPYNTVVVVDFADFGMRSIGKISYCLRKA